MMKKYLIKLKENRVRRNYMGGAGLDRLRGRRPGMDGNRPEDWICSVVRAQNPGMELVENEGLSFIEEEGKRIYIKDLFEKNSTFYLGENKRSTSGFLCKLLDSCMRLQIQAHPDKRFAQKYMDCEYGKFECYYILDVREGVCPYILLGFQNPPAKDQWRKMIEGQDIAAMEACFEKVPVKTGEVWFVPGGMPHAIGEGITMIEIMEPTDLAVRCEFERNGVIVPENARFMNRGIEFCLNVFDYNKYSAADVRENNCVKPAVVEKNAHYVFENLIDEKISGSFRVNKLTVLSESVLQTPDRLLVGIVCDGTVEIQYHDEQIALSGGESFLIAAAATKVKFSPVGKSVPQICLVQ